MLILPLLIKTSFHVKFSINALLMHLILFYVIFNLPILSQIGEPPICDVCHKAKQVRQPFPIHDSCCSSKFELIHLDIWGPYSQPSLTHTGYMLTIVDDSSRATWIFLLKHKSQTTKTFSSFVKMVHTHFDAKIKIVRTNNGGKFVGVDFQKCLSTHGICSLHTYSG